MSETATLEARVKYVIERGMRILPESSWQPVLQRSIDAFYEGREAEGMEACRTLLQATGLPDHIRELTYRNQTFYARPLDELVAGSRGTVLEAPPADGWVSDGPSPVLVDERLMVLLHAMSAPGSDSSTNALLTLDDNLDVTDSAVLGDKTGEADRIDHARPFFTGSVLQAGVIVRRPAGEGPVRAGVVDLVGNAWHNLRLFGPRAGNFQRGWSPLTTDAGSHFVSWWEPTEVFRLAPQTGEFERVALRMAPHFGERFEGGSQGVGVSGGYLFLVNERVAFDEGQPLVFSRFVRIDEGFQITDVSPQFFVTERGQDAASGLARRGDQLIAGFTSGGSQSLLATMNLEQTLAILIPIDAPGRPVVRQVS